MTADRTLPRTIAFAAFTLLVLGTVDYLSGKAAEPAPFASHTNLATPAFIPEDDWTGGPRECDLAKGITTSCLWLD